LPSFLNSVNSKGSYPRIILLFFVLCSSILVATGGDLLSLAGVYTIAFLGVMSLFAFGNLILKETRTELKRT
jgi:amino acid transporter